jgi:hypothetical protein
MRLVKMQQRILIDPVPSQTIVQPDIVFEINSGPITQRQRPVVVWAFKWAPDTVY